MWICSEFYDISNSPKKMSTLRLIHKSSDWCWKQLISNFEAQIASNAKHFEVQPESGVAYNKQRVFWLTINSTIAPILLLIYLFVSTLTLDLWKVVRLRDGRQKTSDATKHAEENQNESVCDFIPLAVDVDVDCREFHVISALNLRSLLSPLPDMHRI